jgi:hypothetical protein
MNRKQFAALAVVVMVTAAPAAAQVTSDAPAPGSSSVIPEKIAPPLKEGRSVAPAANPDNGKAAADPDTSGPAGLAVTAPINPDGAPAPQQH